MELPRDGLEYAHIVFGDLPFNTTVEASVDRKTWTPLTLVGNEARYLIRGPLNTSTAGTPVTAPVTRLWVRVADNPEQVIREAGIISLY